MVQKKRKYNEEPIRKSCIFCCDAEDNEDMFGKFYHKKDLSVHQNCMFFSSGLAQRGSRESDGILGFLIKDIKGEFSRGQKLKCCFCKTNGATIGCVVNNCRKTFHFPCGVRNRVLSQHFGNFASYCHSHKPKQKVIKLKNDLYCHICCTTIAKDELEDCLYSPCCKNNWFHKCCLQKYASSAGMHFFKCPLCNDSSKFLKEMNTYGICVPNKDAAWELETNAFGELLYRPECSAPSCSCRSGRKYDGEGVWDLLVCVYCGADAIHKQCGDIDKSVEKWICNDCKAFEAEKQKLCESSIENVIIPTDVDVVSSIVAPLEPSCSYTIDISEGKSGNNPPDLTIIDELNSSIKNIEENMTEFNPPDLSLIEEESEMLEEENIDNQNSKEIVESKSASECEILLVKNNCLKDNSNVELDSQRKNFSLLLSGKTMKKETIKSSSKQKRRKTLNIGCCSGNNQCIRKMLGFGCQNCKG